MKIPRTISVAIVISLFAFVSQSGCGKEQETRPKEPETEVQKPMGVGRLPKEMVDALHGKPTEGSDERMPKGAMPGMSRAARVPDNIVVPEEMEGKWRAIVVEVVDKDAGKSKQYTVDLNKDFAVPDTGLKLHVQKFLPDFSMSPAGITTLTNEPNNPAAQVSISENGKPVFDGWLFKQFPEVHAFQHPKYAIVLKDHIRVAP